MENFLPIVLYFYILVCFSFTRAIFITQANGPVGFNFLQ